MANCTRYSSLAAVYLVNLWSQGFSPRPVRYSIVGQAFIGPQKAEDAVLIYPVLSTSITLSVLW